MDFNWNLNLTWDWRLECSLETKHDINQNQQGNDRKQESSRHYKVKTYVYRKEEHLTWYLSAKP